MPKTFAVNQRVRFTDPDTRASYEAVFGTLAPTFVVREIRPVGVRLGAPPENPAVLEIGTFTVNVDDLMAAE